jgi:S-adenosylmethionine-diacylgycerolhomoserine-N-methlytransferase
MQHLENYYRLHARLYDHTRWSFLFGREKLLHLLAGRLTPRNVLEIGCGTGHNLLILAQLFPEARLTGLDLSKEMLMVAEKKLTRRKIQATLLLQPYDRPLYQRHDLVLFSYSLSMAGEGLEKMLYHSLSDLADNGYLAIVDFYDTRSRLFNAWMALHSVQFLRERGRIPENFLIPDVMMNKRAFLGLWSYYIYLGRRKARSTEKEN